MLRNFLVDRSWQLDLFARCSCSDDETLMQRAGRGGVGVDLSTVRGGFALQFYRASPDVRVRSVRVLVRPRPASPSSA